MEAQKPNSATPAVKPGSNVRGIKNAFLVIIACFVVAVLLFLSFALFSAIARSTERTITVRKRV